MWDLTTGFSVDAHVLILVDNDTVHGFEQVFTIGGVGQVQFFAERVKFEEIAVGAGGWTGAAVAFLGPGVVALFGKIRTDIFGDGGCLRWDIPHDPVRPCSVWCIGVFHDEG